MDTRCILWPGAKNNKGYGVQRIHGVNKLAHHVAWFIEHGVWPAWDKELDHLCRVRACINVQHLEEVTHQENCKRSPIMGKQRPEGLCMKGLHPWIPENWYVNGDHVRCKQCTKDKAKKQKRKLKEARRLEQS